ncbi:hypothetical protein A2U01_0114661, partial [Trifolium medium]|nr:hypothetical protein [Trifolium medium]
ATPRQKVLGLLARTGEKCKVHLAWRAGMSPGDLCPGLGLSLRILALTRLKSTPNSL